MAPDIPESAKEGGENHEVFQNFCSHHKIASNKRKNHKLDGQFSLPLEDLSKVLTSIRLSLSESYMYPSRMCISAAL